MRKIIFMIHVSLDGYIAGPNGEMDWINYNEEIETYAHSMHARTDTAIYGRVTYEMMAGYWPNVFNDPNATEGDMRHAKWVHDARKIVVSNTLDEVSWHNTSLIKGDFVDAVTKLKQETGKDMWLLGSPTLAQAFLKHHLIDEYRLNINPVILGDGKKLFGPDPYKFQLADSKIFSGGVVGLTYVPAVS